MINVIPDPGIFDCLSIWAIRKDFISTHGHRGLASDELGGELTNIQLLRDGFFGFGVETIESIRSIHLCYKNLKFYFKIFQTWIQYYF